MNTQQKTRISRRRHLPQHTYSIVDKASDLLTISREDFASFAGKVRNDIQGILAQYDIEDKATLKRFYETLCNLDLLDGNAESALQYLDERSRLEDKLVEKLLSGVLERPLIKAWEEAENKDPRLIRETFRQKLRAALEKLPRDTVQDDIENIKGQLEMTGRNVLIGIVQSQVDPGVTKIKRISRDIAEKIIWCRTYIEIIEPLKNDIIEIFNTYIAKHEAPRRNFWKDREVDLLGTKGLHPVIIGIWDTGVDVEIFRDQLFAYNAEGRSGRDGASRGAASDLHGIAFDLNEEKTMGLLYPLSDSDVKRLPQVKDYIKGITDIQAAVDSREARAMKKKIGAMQPEEVKPLMEEVTLFTYYCHGTHVAGIAARGNPYARILTVRITFDYRLIPEPFTVQRARRAAENYQKTVGYLPL